MGQWNVEKFYRTPTTEAPTQEEQKKLQRLGLFKEVQTNYQEDKPKVQINK